MSTTLTPSMRRSMLIAALRDPSMWPEGFKWDFDSCKSCAMGLLIETLKIDCFAGAHCYSVQTATLLGLRYAKVLEIFHSPAAEFECDIISSFESIEAVYKAVTPEMIAERLERAHKSIIAAEQASSK